MNNAVLSHFGQCADIVIFMALFHQNVFRLNAKKTAFVLLDIFALFCIVMTYDDGLDRFPVLSGSIIRIGIICLVLYYYFEVFKYEYIDDLSAAPGFWIKSMYLLYFCGTFAHHLLINNENAGQNVLENVNAVNWILIIVFNLVFTLAIWLGRVRKV